jgi:hypothetical protein
MVYSPFPLVSADLPGKDGSVVLVALTETFANGKFVAASVTLPEIAPGTVNLALILGVSSPAVTATGSAVINESFSL